MKSDQFIDLSAQTEAIKKLVPIRKSKNLIKANFIPLTNSSNVVKDNSHPEDSTVEIQREGDFIEMIKVNCSCGKSTQILLEYDENKPKSGIK